MNDDVEMNRQTCLLTLLNRILIETAIQFEMRNDGLQQSEL